MSTAVARLRDFYGANPLHLLALLGCFALAGYAALQLAAEPTWPAILLWFLGAVIAHDLVALPLYSLADRSLSAGLRAVTAGRGGGSPGVPAVNYLRVPLLGTGLLFLLFFPGIIGQGAKTYLDATGQTQEPFLARWLLLTGALFLISALAYAVRLARRARTGLPDTSPGPDGKPDRRTRAR